MNKKNLIITAVICMWVLQGCTPAKTSNEKISQAESLLNSSDYGAAAIKLKNLLKDEPKHIEARIMLGKSYMLLGDYEAAAKELSFALKYGAEPTNVLPHLTKVLYVLDRNAELLDLVGSHTLDTLSSVTSFYTGLAYIKVGDEKAAEKAFNESVTVEPQNEYSILATIYLEIQNGDIEVAKSALEKLLSEQPNYTDALLLNAQLAYGEGKFERAAKTLDSYLKLLPFDVKSKFMLTDSYIKLENYEQASKVIDSLLAKYPQNGLSNYYKGIITYYQKDFPLAKQYMEIAIQSGFQNFRSRLVAGYSNFHLKQYEQALVHFKIIQSELVENDPTHRIIAATQLLVGEYDSAASTIVNLNGIPEHDTPFLTSTSFQFLKMGDKESARSILSKLDEIDTDNPMVLLRKGILKGALTEESGLKDIQLALKEDGKLPGGKLALVSAYILEQKYIDALEVTHEMRLDKTTALQGLNIAAQIYIKMDDLEQAAEAFREALIINPLNIPSLVYFYKTAIAKKDYQGAIKYLDTILTIEPIYQPALNAFYDTYQLAGIQEKALEKLETLYQKDTANIEVAITYASALMRAKMFRESLALLKSLDLEKVKSKQLYWQLLNENYYTLRDFNLVIETFEQWTTHMPLSKAAWLSWANLQERFGNFSEALTVIEKSKRHIKNDEDMALVHAYYLVQNDETELAESILTKLSVAKQNTAMAKGIKGQIHAQKGKFNEAIPFLLEEYSATKTDRSAARLFMIYMSNKETSKAVRLMEDHLEVSPNFINGHNYLASYWLSIDTQKAISQYKKILNLNPNHIMSLNNLAWLFYETKNYEDADNYASQAIAVAPENPNVLDTAGIIKIALKDKPAALKLLKKAQLKAPENTDIKKHYQQALNM